MITPFATRAHNHNWKLDPIIRSLLDTDWYKLAMLQFIWKYFHDTRATFSLINRKKSVKLARIIPRHLLVMQLDHVRTLRFRRSELIWLAGNTFYGREGIFKPDFLAWLAGFRLPQYRLEERDGQWELTFEGTWLETTMWEIYALAIVSELRTRAVLETMSEFELDILYSRAKAKFWEKILRLRGVPGLRIADFATRRRHSFLWHEYIVLMMKAELPDIFVGTSNAYLAFKHDLEAIGTNAHELPMTLAALARQGLLGGLSLKESQYEVVRLWQEMYGNTMLVLLPDTFGSSQFFRDAPEWIVRDAIGFRPDSKEAFEGIQEGIDFFSRIDQDVTRKLVIPSDGLDVDSILAIHARFAGDVQDGFDARRDFRTAADFLPQADGGPPKWIHNPKIRISDGWGTMEANDFIDCHPRGLADLDPISIVCKVTAVEGHPAVKLSDNLEKATGAPDEVGFYYDEFGRSGMKGIKVRV